MQECHQRLDDRTPALLTHTQRAGHRRWDKRRIDKRRQVDEKGSIWEEFKQISRSLQREPRLAHPTGPRQRHQVNILTLEKVGNLTEFPFATQQRRRLTEEVVRTRLQRPEGWKLDRQVRMSELIDPLRLEQVAQPMVTEVSEFDPSWKGTASELLDRLRQQDLSTVSSREESCEPVERRSQVITAR